jgi:hypothetical protein
MKVLPRLICALFLLVLLAGVSFAQITATQRGALRRRGVAHPLAVEVGEIDGKLSQRGLTQDQIQTDVELRLRKAGISIKNRQEILSYPQIYVTLLASNREDSKLYTYMVRVQVNDGFSRSCKEPGSMILATVWEEMSLGTVGENHLRDLREDVADLVDRLINDYLAANPKP